MTDIKRIGSTGIHTVEGNVAGSRAALLTQQREKQQAEYEAQKKLIKAENAAGTGAFAQKFAAASSSAEDEFRRKTVGLVTLDEFTKAAKEVDDLLRERQLAEERAKEEQTRLERKKAEQSKRHRKMASSLSFADDEEAGAEDNDGDEAVVVNSKKSKKNPDVVTSHLPDRERDLAISLEKQRLAAEWLAQQEEIKKEVHVAHHHARDHARRHRSHHDDHTCLCRDFCAYL